MKKGLSLIIYISKRQKAKVKRNKVVPSRMGWKMAGKVLSFPWDEEELIKI